MSITNQKGDMNEIVEHLEAIGQWIIGETRTAAMIWWWQMHRRIGTSLRSEEI